MRQESQSGIRKKLGFKPWRQGKTAQTQSLTANQQSEIGVTVYDQ
jgi:hypothetical protein